MENNPQLIYRHYKNKLYKYLGLVKHSETLEDLVLYMPIKDNPDKQPWVRPKEMFFEKIDFEGRRLPRFEPVVFKYSVFKDLDPELKTRVCKLAQDIFQDFTEQDLDTKLADKKNILIQIVIDNTTPDVFKLIGFKIGFELTNNTFYSWLGAVDFEYRGLGIANELMKQQHTWCETMGYKCIETKTKNEWKAMLMLNLKYDFAIVGTEYNTKKELKIIMKKTV